MPYCNVSPQNTTAINIYYEVLGKGKPVLFISGWPLSGSMWEYQINSLIKQGISCITYDRRGFGKSDRHADGYDYDTLSHDLKCVIDAVGVKDITLVGFSMGGGEIAKYFAKFGDAKINKVVLISAVVPYMLQTADNPNGVPKDDFDSMLEGITTDRPTFFETFNKDFYGESMLKDAVSKAYLTHSLIACMDASPLATAACAKAFATTDFRNDVPKINVPTLIIHGDKDKTVPIKATGEQTANLLPNAMFKVYEDAPHGLWFTHQQQLNTDLLEFINS